MTLLNWVPLLVILFMIGNWERDKYVARRDHKRAFKAGFEAGSTDAQALWEQTVENMVRKGIKDLVAGIPQHVVVTRLNAQNRVDRVWPEDLVEIPAFNLVIGVQAVQRIIAHVGGNKKAGRVTDVSHLKVIRPEVDA